MKKFLLLLLLPFTLYAEVNSKNYVGIGYSGETKEVSNAYNQHDLVYSATKRHHVSMSTMTNFTVQGGNVINTNGMYRLGYDNIFRNNTTLFVFNQTFLNPVTDMNLRNDIGIGVKTFLVKTQMLTFDVSSAPVFTYTKFSDYYQIKGGASFRGKIEFMPTDADTFTAIHFYIIGADYQSFHVSSLSYYRELTPNLFSGIDSYFTYETITGNQYYNLNLVFGIKL